ncbi:MAG: LLM class flavin-dependent oxidoreductase [Aigarchaeota archaeon]|nr:LLM class flavin-dependent oxidoreductase [Candidatus Pelearchaeum maunauluense]
MRFGLIIPNMSPYCDVKPISEAARVAEDSGFEALLIWDHYTLPWSDATLDAWVVLSYLSSITERIRLGTCVSPIPFRNPAVLAKIAASVDIISGGRVILGVGAGWHRPEFEGFSEWYPDAERVTRTFEGVKIMKALWERGRLSYEGRYYKVRGAVVEPRPIQRPGPPLWFGTTGRRMLRFAAENGDGWIPTMTTPREYSKLASYLRQHIKTDKLPNFTFAYADFDIYNTPNEYITTIEKYGSVGCMLYCVTWRFPKQQFIAKLREFAREVMPSFG